MFLRRKCLASQKAKRLCFDISLALGLLFTLWAAEEWQNFTGVCSSIREDTLRLHVVAASNTLQDQYIKLKVKDAILEESRELFEGCRDIDETHERAAASLAKLKLTAGEAAAREGFSGPVEVYLTDMYFETRQYNGFTLPAGTYRALRVELGDHRGKNWWCVLYPGLCLPGCTAAQYPQKEEQELVTGEYQIRFALLEAWQKLTEKTEK